MWTDTFIWSTSVQVNKIKAWPPHVLLSSSLYPMGHWHSNPIGRSTQMCEQPPLLSKHSFKPMRQREVWWKMTKNYVKCMDAYVCERVCTVYGRMNTDNTITGFSPHQYFQICVLKTRIQFMHSLHPTRLWIKNISIHWFLKDTMRSDFFFLFL